MQRVSPDGTAISHLCLFRTILHAERQVHPAAPLHVVRPDEAAGANSSYCRPAALTFQLIPIPNNPYLSICLSLFTPGPGHRSSSPVHTAADRGSRCLPSFPPTKGRLPFFLTSSYCACSARCPRRRCTPRPLTGSLWARGEGEVNVNKILLASRPRLKRKHSLWGQAALPPPPHKHMMALTTTHTHPPFGQLSTLARGSVVVADVAP